VPAGDNAATAGRKLARVQAPARVYDSCIPRDMIENGPEHRDAWRRIRLLTPRDISRMPQIEMGLVAVWPGAWAGMKGLGASELT
jgi:hypothetical protein